MPDPIPLRFFVWLEEQAQGPYEADGIREMFRNGQIGPETLLFREGSNDDWFPAGDRLEAFLPPPKIIQEAQPAPETEPPEQSLTPSGFGEFIGQDRVKARLELALAAAKQRGESLGHVLLVGPPGAGKATLGQIVAKSMGASLKSVSASQVSKAGDLAGLLTNLEEGDVLFIDEAFRLHPVLAEYLCHAMQHFLLDVVVDQGSNARSVRLNLPRFTVIGTTLVKNRMPTELLSCFQIIENMEAYSGEQLAAIACWFATRLGLKLQGAAAREIARTSDGTPQDVLRRLRHVRDYAHVKSPSEDTIAVELASAALNMLSPPEAPNKSEGRQGIPSEVRREVWRRDGGKCVKCGSRENLEYDHIIPVSKGGSNTARNIELLCEACNRSKNDSIQ